jgi:ElaB/YqjD/DUF883 family membrane-anchored ribosome-binding protein
MATIEELEHEADRRKLRFEARLDEVKRRLTPSGIADEALRAIDSSGKTASVAAVDTARRNPLLALGLAAGAGWLLLGARQSALRASRRARTNSHKKMKEIGHGNGNR